MKEHHSNLPFSFSWTQWTQELVHETCSLYKDLVILLLLCVLLIVVPFFFPFSLQKIWEWLLQPSDVGNDGIEKDILPCILFVVCVPQALLYVYFIYRRWTTIQSTRQEMEHVKRRNQYIYYVAVKCWPEIFDQAQERTLPQPAVNESMAEIPLLSSHNVPIVQQTKKQTS